MQLISRFPSWCTSDNNSSCRQEHFPDLSVGHKTRLDFRPHRVTLPCERACLPHSQRRGKTKRHYSHSSASGSTETLYLRTFRTLPRPAAMDRPSEEPPQSINPYKALGLSKAASPAEVKTAYKKLALKHHPGSRSLLDIASLY